MSDEFDELVDQLKSARGDFHAQYLESRQELLRAYPQGVDIAAIGYHAWQQLTPMQRALGLNDLFTAYYYRVRDEEQSTRLNTAATDPAKTYLGPDDLMLLSDSLAYAEPGNDRVVNEVPADALSNVLMELELLQHRLAMRDAESGGC